MNIQPHNVTMLDQLVWSAVTAGFGIAVGVVLGIVIGVHLANGRRPVTTASAPAAPVTREVIREYIREVPAAPPVLNLDRLDRHQLDRLDRSEVTR